MKRSAALLLVSTISICPMVLASQPRLGSNAADFRSSSGPSANSIATVLFTATDRLFLSVDGGGSVASTYTVQAQKPSSSATVRQAFLLAASTGFSDYSIPNGAAGIRLNGVGITWTREISSAIVSRNYQADVTSLIKPALDTTGTGRTTFTITETNSNVIDGVVLAVVWNDPAQTGNSTVVLLFGAQSTTGDSFAINLAAPIQPTAPGALLKMGLGTSFSAQGLGSPGDQYSEIEVNGARVSSSSGGEDDGELADGALITVGGLDDSIANPANPYGGHNDNPRTDDELYSLLPFITSNTTQVNVTTSNPSNDDNIFLAYFVISGGAVVTTGACTPDPTTLCLDDQTGDRRFKAELSYSSSQSGGISGNAKAISLTALGVPRGGLFWFFSADNPEVLVKVLNGCPVNSRYWVFYSAGTNLGFTLKVTDTKTGATFLSSNPDLKLAPPVANTSAFACN